MAQGAGSLVLYAAVAFLAVTGNVPRVVFPRLHDAILGRHLGEMVRASSSVLLTLVPLVNIVVPLSLRGVLQVTEWAVVGIEFVVAAGILALNARRNRQGRTGQDEKEAMDQVLAHLSRTYAVTEETGRGDGVHPLVFVQAAEPTTPGWPVHRLQVYRGPRQKIHIAIGIGGMGMKRAHREEFIARLTRRMGKRLTRLRPDWVLVQTKGWEPTLDVLRKLHHECADYHEDHHAAA